MKTHELILHDTVRAALERHAKNGTHALLLVGSKGSGKHTIARSFAAQLLDITPEKLEHAPYFNEITPSGASISVEQIRDLQHVLSLRTTGSNAVRRVLYISQADAMTAEAQNALLKTLEEPPADTVLLLTANELDALLPTIRSRLQVVHITPPPLSVVSEFFVKQGYDSTSVARMHAISGGAVGLMNALLADDNTHEMVQAIERAKKVLAASVYERLCMVDGLSKQKDETMELISALKRVALAALEKSGVNGSETQAKAWHRRLANIVHAEELLLVNANTKLVLTDLFMSL